MAEERSESREVTWRQLLPWTELFRGFHVALDLNKLLLAAAGIFVTWFGWWLLAVIFQALVTSGAEGKRPPDWTSGKYKPEEWSKFRDEQYLWFRVAENTFDNFVYSVKKPAPPAKKS